MQGTHRQQSETISEFYSKVRKYSEEICAPLETEDFLPQPVVDVSPPKWNIAHTTWFFEEMILKKFVPDYREFSADFGFFFNSYYNSVGARTLRHKRGDLARPTVKEAFEYRRFVDEKMLAFLAADLPPGAREAVVLGLNHEQQHQELLLTDIKYIFAVNPKNPVYQKDFAPEETAESEPASGDEYLSVPEGIYEIGHSGGGFCFDNELSRHKVFLHDFQIGLKLVTNGEFVEFVEAGGYEDFNLWHAEGLDWVRQNRIGSPLYWQKIDNRWHQFTLGGLREIRPEAPVAHVSFYEAAAFAEWRGARLPTEFEWETAAQQFGWGRRWEWTNSAYLPYPGFKKPPGAIGEYNGKFMINQMVLRGASIATPEGHSRKTYRNFFHPHLRWQFTGIRLAK